MRKVKSEKVRNILLTILKKYIRIFLEFIIHFTPKFDQVLIVGNKSAFVEPNTIELANYISQNTNKTVYFVLNKKCRSHIRKHIRKNVRLVNYISAYQLLLLLISKYIFTTSGTYIDFFSKQQVYVNVGHGAGHKRIRKLINKNMPGIYADVTVATSEMTKKKFAKAFDVHEKDVFISGYPRNDLMLRAEKNRLKLKQSIFKLGDYDKIIIWLPTFRVNYVAGGTDGFEANNPFQITGFATCRFNNLLKYHNALCVVKPHPSSIQHYDYSKYDNIYIMDDEWLFKKGLTLYHLLPITDILITDFSSVMVDYLLLNRPVTCFSTDYNAYRDSRGFYFDNVEDMLPSKLIQEQETFFEHLQGLLAGDRDPYIDKRVRIRDLYFTYKDASSTKRLVEHVIGAN